jgi:hypothetical protein
MPTTTTNIDAFLEATGLAGTAGFVVYAADGSTQVVTRSASVSLISEIGSTGNYQATITVSFDTLYKVVWDDGSANWPAQMLYLPSGFNLTTVNGQAVRNGNGTAVAITTTTIDLDTTDPYRAANLDGWTVEILNATTGAGQVATITLSGLTSPFRQTFSPAITLPTGTVTYKLTPPQPATVDPTAVSDAVWNATGKLGDGSKPAWKTLTKAVARMFGKFDRASVPGWAVISKVDGSGEAFRQTYSNTANPARGNHTPGSGL